MDRLFWDLKEKEKPKICFPLKFFWQRCYVFEASDCLQLTYHNGCFWGFLFKRFLRQISIGKSDILKRPQRFETISQCPRPDLDKRFLPRPKTITAWKLIPHRYKISKNWNPPRWVPLNRFFKNWLLLIQKQLDSNYIYTRFT